MKSSIASFVAGLTLTLFIFGSRSVSQSSSTATNASASQELPAWAYLHPPSRNTFSSGDKIGEGATSQADLRHVPDSIREYPQSFLRSMFNTADWFPDTHPTMPEVVAHGRQPNVFACAFCHLPNGMARPENQNIAGLPVAYIAQQVHDFKSGVRKSSDPKMMSVQHMANVASAVSEEDINAAATYYSAIKPTASTRVVETDMVPKTKVVGFMLQRTGDGDEPIDGRIIELAEDRDLTELHDERSGFVVYVPKGSVRKGKELAANGANGKSISCVTCHGSDLRGVGNIPSIAGRSPSPLVRQMIDFQTGARHGEGAMLMKPVVQKLSLDDIVNIVSYLTTLNP